MTKIQAYLYGMHTHQGVLFSDLLVVQRIGVNVRFLLRETAEA